MRSFSATLLFGIFAASCVQPTQPPSESLSVRFNNYREIVNITKNSDKLTIKVKTFYSANLWRDGTEKSEKKSNTKKFYALNFPMWIIDISSIKETIDGNQGCLLVNGLNNKKEKSALHIIYISENNTWVIDDITYQILSDYEAYFDEPVCNEEKRQAIWLKQVDKL